MKSIRHKGGVIRFVLIFIAIICCIFTAFYLFLPHIVESWLIPGIKTQIGIETAGCDIRSISSSGLDIGDLFVGTSEDSGLLIDAVYLDYSLSGIFKKEINNIHISGLRIFSRYENGHLIIPGLYPSRLFEKSDRTDESSEKPDFNIRHLEISNAIIVIDIGGNAYEIPIDMKISPQTRFMQGLNFFVTARPFNQPVEITADLDFIKNVCRATVSSNKIRLGEISEISEQLNLSALRGDARLTIAGEIDLSPFSLSSLTADLAIDNFRTTHPNFELTNLNDKNASSPLTIHIKQLNRATWHMALSSLSLAPPFPLSVNHFKCRIENVPNGFTGEGNLKLSFPEKAHPAGFKHHVLSPAEISGQCRFKYENEGEWSFSIESLPIKGSSLAFKTGEYTVTTGQPDLSISGTGFKAKGDAQFLISFPPINATKDAMTISIPKLTLKGNASSGSAENIVDLKIQAKKSILKMDASQRVDIPLFTFSGNMKALSTKDRVFSGSMSFSNAAYSQPDAVIRGISGQFPISWPWQPDTRSGTYTVSDIFVDNMDLGAVKGTWKQKFLGILFDGSYDTNIIPGFGLDFKGKSGLFDDNEFMAALSFENRSYEPFVPFDLNKLIPAAKDIQIDGHFDIMGDLFYDKFGIKSSVFGRFSDGVIRMPENDITMRGINGSISMTDLLQLKSAPKQRIEFSEAVFGGINIQNGYVQYQIESPESYLIEKSGFNWCNGNIETLSLRIVRGVSDYDLTLFCDRLNLAMILEQFGAADAAGIGTVNGRIPLRYKNGQLTFNNGFLFSTPGDGGTIRVKGTERLTAGIDPNSPQFTQIELAREALKNYDYKWAKLNLETQGEDLLLKLKFDGKPTNPLPFVYKKEIGGFAKVEAGGQGSVFQGINLDLNFRLPLDKILQYQDVFNMIE